MRRLGQSGQIDPYIGLFRTDRTLIYAFCGLQTNCSIDGGATVQGAGPASRGARAVALRVQVPEERRPGRLARADGQGRRHERRLPAQGRSAGRARASAARDAAAAGAAHRVAGRQARGQGRRRADAARTRSPRTTSRSPTATRSSCSTSPPSPARRRAFACREYPGHVLRGVVRGKDEPDRRQLCVGPRGIPRAARCGPGASRRRHRRRTRRTATGSTRTTRRRG